MNLKDLRWNLGRIADCSVLDDSSRETARAANLILAALMNATNAPGKLSVEEFQSTIERYTASGAVAAAVVNKAAS